MWDQCSFLQALLLPTAQLCLFGQDWHYCCLLQRCSCLLAWKTMKQSLCSIVCQLGEVHHQKYAPGEHHTETKHNRVSLCLCAAQWHHCGVKQWLAAASKECTGAYITLSSGMYNLDLFSGMIQEDDLLRYHRRLRLQAQISWVFLAIPLHILGWTTISEELPVSVMISWQEHSWRHAGEDITAHVSLTAVRISV